MNRRPPHSPRTEPLFPCTTLFRSFGLVEVCGRMPGAERPRHDIDVIFLAHGFEPRDLLRAQSGRIAVEKAADHIVGFARAAMPGAEFRSEEHTSELQSLMRSSYAVFCLKQKYTQNTRNTSRT